MVIGSTTAFSAGISHGAKVREVSSKAFLTEIPQSSSMDLCLGIIIWSAGSFGCISFPSPLSSFTASSSSRSWEGRRQSASRSAGGICGISTCGDSAMVSEAEASGWFHPWLCVLPALGRRTICPVLGLWCLSCWSLRRVLDLDLRLIIDSLGCHSWELLGEVDLGVWRPLCSWSPCALL